jgi:hypothetical protein
MKKQRAFLIIVSVLLGSTLLLVGGLVGIISIVTKNHPEPFRAARQWIYINSLDENERAQLIIDDLKELENVEDVEMISNTWTETVIDIVVSKQNITSDTISNISGTCNEGEKIWGMNAHVVQCSLNSKVIKY